MECLGLSPTSTSDSSYLLRHILGCNGDSSNTRVFVPTWETWTEFLASGFGLVQLWLLWEIGSEQANGNLSPRVLKK